MIFLLAPTLHVGAYIVDWVDSYWLQYAFPRTAWERRMLKNLDRSLR